MLKWLLSLFKTQETLEKPSPKVRIKPEQVGFVAGNLIVQYADTCYVAAIAPTNSMDPVVDEGMYVVLDKGVPYTDLISGDILCYKASWNGEVLHRIIEIGEDQQGWYCRTQGDNNSQPDPERIRKEQIISVWRATIN